LSSFARVFATAAIENRIVYPETSVLPLQYFCSYCISDT